jgi:uncharacterized protein YndB with AHSA1/START domain
MSTTTPAPQTLVQHIRLKASAERVYKALTDATELQKWFPEKASSDPRVGGSLRFEFNKGGVPFVAEGKYLALEPNKLVSYSWHSALDEAGSTLTNLTVVFRLEANGDHTDLYLEETGYGEGSLYEGVFGERSHGWGFFLGNLEALLGGGADMRVVGKAPCDE